MSDDVARIMALLASTSAGSPGPAGPAGAVGPAGPPGPPLAGNPNAVSYFDGAGAPTSSPDLIAGSLDPFGRPQVLDRRAGGAGPVYRQGAWQQDGDPSNVVGDCLVLYGQSTAGVQDAVQGAYCRLKPTRLGWAQTLIGVPLFYGFRADALGTVQRDDAGAVTSEIRRSDGRATVGSVVIGVGGPTWTKGVGSPEGVVTAPTGSLYSNTAGGVSTTLYVKESGAGNVGWVPK